MLLLLLGACASSTPREGRVQLAALDPAMCAQQELPPYRGQRPELFALENRKVVFAANNQLAACRGLLEAERRDFGAEQ